MKTDQRAVYTTSVNKYFWGCVTEDKIWKVAQRMLGAKLPSGPSGMQIEKSMPAARDKDLTILVLRADRNWETAIDLLKWELVIGMGTLKLKKRRDGAGALHLVRKRKEALERAKKKKAAAEDSAALAAAAAGGEIEDAMVQGE